MLAERVPPGQPRQQPYTTHLIRRAPAKRPSAQIPRVSQCGSKQDESAVPTHATLAQHTIPTPLPRSSPPSYIDKQRRTCMPRTEREFPPLAVTLASIAALSLCSATVPNYRTAALLQGALQLIHPSRSVRCSAAARCTDPVGTVQDRAGQGRTGQDPLFALQLRRCACAHGG